MRLLVLAPSLQNTSPGSRFRVEQWMQRWEKEGVECVYRSFEDEDLHQVIYRAGNRVKKATGMMRAFARRFTQLFDLRSFDAVFLYEEASRIGPAILEIIIAKSGVPIIYDFCDPIYLAYKSPSNSYLSYLKFFGKTATICELAAKVIVGNDELGDYARQHSRDVSLVPITIDTEHYRARTWAAKPPTIPLMGWSGSHTTAPHLAGLSTALQRLAKDKRFALEVIGAPAFAIPGVDVRFVPWRAASEVEDLSRFDLGIMPLPNDEWTRLRSHLKIRQYMGLGIPCVASPVGVNKELIEDGKNGFLATSDDEWVEKLTRLIDDADLRKRLGTAGRKTIEERYSAKVWAPRVLEIIRSAIDERKEEGSVMASLQREPMEHLLSIFRSAPNKHEAHVRSASLLRDLSADRAFLKRALRQHLQTPGVLNTRNYPVVGVNVVLNEHFGVVINCWIPLPDHDAKTSTKAIHHHGDMLLSTATVMGPGYEHWLFTKPRALDEAALLYDIGVVERSAHPSQHVAFVDSDTPHLPWYPPDTTLTLCLWSSKHPVTWRDRLKRIPLLKQNEQRLRKLTKTLGLDGMAARAMQLKKAELFDFYPVDGGFRGMVERQEYDRGPNEDHLYSLFHVLQRTGNEDLVSVIEERMRVERDLKSRALLDTLVVDLKAGRPIEGRLSSCHLGVPHAMFTQSDVELAIASQRRA